MNEKLRNWRKNLYKLIASEENSRPHKIYTLAMAFIILLSLLPLAFRDERPWMGVIEIVCVGVFVADYLFRWFTADLRYKKADGN